MTTAWKRGAVPSSVSRPPWSPTSFPDILGNGNLHAQVNIDSGDEFAALGRAFNTMGRRLAHSHDEMEKRISQATSDLSAANQELQKLDKMKTDFFADMSHELRSPITAIQGGVDYLSRTVADPDCRSYLAIKFSYNDGRVDVALSALDGQAHVSVADEGVGISPENLEKVFEKFYTLPSCSRTHSVTGTGLGLTICKKIVEAHGGRMVAQCRNGSGCLFTFTLPLKL